MFDNVAARANLEIAAALEDMPHAEWKSIRAA